MDHSHSIGMTTLYGKMVWKQQQTAFIVKKTNSHQTVALMQILMYSSQIIWILNGEFYLQLQ